MGKKQKQKVILLGTAYPLRGGLAAFNERLIREYQLMGWETEIYTFSLQYPGFLFPGKTQYSDDPPPTDLNIRVTVNSINPLNWIRVGMEIRKKRPDYLLIKFWIPFMAPCFGTIARIVRGNRFTKVISIIDNIIPHEKRIGDRILAKYWTSSADGFVSMSRKVHDEVKTFTLKPAIVCPHPVYDNYGSQIPKAEARQKLGLDPEVPHILFFGFIRDYKGLDLLLRAMADEGIRDLGIRLLVAGEFYSDPKPYHDLIRELGLSDQVILCTEFIPEGDVAAYFCAADMVVQPYKSATQSGVTQIAYHFNKPMIITRVGGLEEFVPNGVAGYVVEPDPVAISAAILRFYRENKEAEFSKNTERVKQKYSWYAMTDAIDSLFWMPEGSEHLR
jgi:D-inositol-3-phosphate glycosyltransferase